MVDQHSQHVDNWSAAGMAGMFDAVHRQRDRARYRRRVFLWCLTIAICLGVPLGITWGKFQDARRQTLLEEFASRRPAAEKLTQTNPAIASVLTRSDALRDSARTSSIAEAIANLRQSLQLLTDAHNLERDTKRVRQILDPVGLTLLETPWHVSSTVISQQQKELGKRHKSIVALLDQGKVELAEQELARLLSDIGKLQRGNVEAMQTSLSRQGWNRLRTSIPERLADDPAWEAINSVGDDAEQGWDAGEWTEARTLYARAIERSEQFLDSQLDPAEKARLLQSDAETLARLETEKADLSQQIESFQQNINDLSQQLATTNGERQSALALVDTLTTERDRLRTESATDRAELKDLRPLKVQLADVTKSMANAQQQVAELTTARQTAEESVRKLESQLTARNAEVTAFRTAAGSGGEDPALVQVSATLAAIESQLAEGFSDSDSSQKVERATDQLADALAQYDMAVALKERALADKYLPTSSKVKSINVTITQAEGTLSNALKILDEPLAAQYEELQSVITSAEADYQKLLQEVTPENEDAKSLKSRIDELSTQQYQFADPHSRHSGRTIISSGSELATRCRVQVEEPFVELRQAEFARLRADGKLPAVANIEFVAINVGTFTMGSTKSANESTTSNAEKPAHKVSITRPFFAGKYEVTVGQILTWLNAPGVSLNDQWIYLSHSDCPIRKSGSRFALNTDSDFGQTIEQPMVNITWYGAVAFCGWCAQQDSHFTIRLPTEAEWEYMARAGSTTAYPWGDLVNGMKANIDGNYSAGTTKRRPPLRKTVNVGSYQPNAWGLYDTVGNAYELCSDWYNADYYSHSPTTNPTGPASGGTHVIRGGSCLDDEVAACSSCRIFWNSSLGSPAIGFRVVAEPVRSQPTSSNP